MFRDCARLERNVFVTWKENDVDKQDVDERKKVLSHIWVKSESDLGQISTRSLTSFNQSWYARNKMYKLSLLSKLLSVMILAFASSNFNQFTINISELIAYWLELVDSAMTQFLLFLSQHLVDVTTHFLQI